MEHQKILKRAWHVLWSYRALWLFGAFLAVTTFSWETAFLLRDNDRDGERQGITFQITPSDDFTIEVPELYDLTGLDKIPQEVMNWIIAVGITLACISLILIIVMPILRYVSEVAMIRMVDEYETGEEQYAVRQGFRKGWSRSAWRLFLIDLVINIPALLALLLAILFAGSPLLLWATENTLAGIVGIVTTIGLFFLALFFATLTVAVLSLLKQFIRRACVLEGLGVIEAIRQGYLIVRKNLKDIGLMWLVMLGIDLGWPIIMIPAMFLLFFVAALLGGGTAILAGGIGRLFAEGGMPWVVGGMVGIPVFILVIVAPLAFLGGLRETFQSSTWTLTYRELRAMENLDHAELAPQDLAEG